MKLVTWNINGVVKRLDQLLDWLDETSPDIVCLQELKCTPMQFPEAALKAAGYSAVWVAEGRWNGVAVVARGDTPNVTRSSLPGDDTPQARYIEAAVGGLIVASVYVPNGNPAPGPKFDYKLAWMHRLHAHAADLLRTGAPVFLAGDFNVVASELDIYPTRSYDDSALTHIECREKLQALLALGYTDSFRKQHPDAPGYTFWDYRRNRWERNAGLRLDLVLANDLAGMSITTSAVERDLRSCENPSDHAPVCVSLW